MNLAKYLGAPVAAACLVQGGCAEAPEPERVYDDRTLGTELYLIACGHLAGTYFPNDVQGKVLEDTCFQDDPAPASAPRLETLRKSRARLVSALDAVLADDAYGEDELGSFVHELLPLLDKPTQLLPDATHAIAEMVNAVRDSPEALAALERIRAPPCARSSG